MSTSAVMEEFFIEEIGVEEKVSPNMWSAWFQPGISGFHSF